MRWARWRMKTSSWTWSWGAQKRKSFMHVFLPCLLYSTFLVPRVWLLNMLFCVAYFFHFFFLYIRFLLVYSRERAMVAYHPKSDQREARWWSSRSSIICWNWTVCWGLSALVTRFDASSLPSSKLVECSARRKYKKILWIDGWDMRGAASIVHCRAMKNYMQLWRSVLSDECEKKRRNISIDERAVVCESSYYSSLKRFRVFFFQL